MKSRDLYLVDVIEADDRLVCISFVKEPANKRVLNVLSDNGSEMTIVCPIVIANELIFRNDKGMGDRFILFPPKSVLNLIRKATTERTIFKYDREHDCKLVDGIVMTESFVIDYANGIKGYKGLTGLNDGSWIGKFTISDTFIIEAIRNKEICGVSISAYITEEKMELNEIVKLYKRLKI